MDIIDFALSRLCYAPFPQDLEEARRDGMSRWLDRQLGNPAAHDDAECRDRLRRFTLQIKYGAGNGQQQSGGDTNNWPAMDEMRSLRYVEAPIENPWALLDPKIARPGEEKTRPYHEAVAATFVRAFHNRFQVAEQLTAFWHDHFSVFAVEDQKIGAALPSYDRDAIRPNAAGNFRDMLEAVAKSPAMQIYLSNWTSRAGAANENYARELMELHTLGREAYLNDRYDRWRDVPGAPDRKPAGYIDEDVYEAARAFTGWTVENGQRLDSATELPRTGKFTYVDSWHDGYQKRVLATEFTPFGAPMADGRKALDLAAFHPATAHYICAKLCRRFVSDAAPRSLVNSAAQAWIENAKKPGQIGTVLKHIALSPEFAAAQGAKARSPLALAVSFARETGIDFVPNAPFEQQMSNCGQRLFGWPSPDGRPDTAAYYLTPENMRQRWTLTARLAANAMGNGQPRAFASTVLSAVPRAGGIVGHWLRVFAGEGVDVPKFLAHLGGDPRQLVTDERRAAQLVGLCAAAPQFQTT